MDTEIELKLEVPENARQLIEEKLLPDLEMQSQSEQSTLSNHYYDTPQQVLRRHHIGFRVRGCNGRYEQTVKTAGEVVGGLHQRPEHNLAIADSVPDITLFEAHIWPLSLTQLTAIDQLQQDLQCQFTTHFERTTYQLQSEQSLVEMALDNGEISAGGRQQKICELELELKQGRAEDLFNLAEAIQRIMPVRTSDLSKAARGYALANQQSLSVRSLAGFLPLKTSDSTEQAFCSALTFASSHWQHHEDTYLQTGKPAALMEMLQAMRLMLQAVSLFLPQLQCTELLNFHRDLFELQRRWHWLEELKGIRSLRSNKGPFSKRLAKHPELMSYFHGRSEGMFQHHRPKHLIYHPLYSTVQLQYGRLLQTKPWRRQGHNGDEAVMEHVKGWLSQGWQTVLQSIPYDKTLTPQNYVALETTLRPTLLNGFILAGLFEQAPHRFRAPWLDILVGIEEIRALQLLQEALPHSVADQQEALQEWSEEKMQSLLDVMEQSRAAAMQAEAYWN